MIDLLQIGELKHFHKLLHVLFNVTMVIMCENENDCIIKIDGFFKDMVDIKCRLKARPCVVILYRCYVPLTRCTGCP